MYQMARQKSDGRAPIIALISLENRETPTMSKTIFAKTIELIFVYHKTMKLQYIRKRRRLIRLEQRRFHSLN